MFANQSEDELVVLHAPLVRRLALQLMARLPANVELDDLLQAGMLGLLDAIRRYQENPEANFETYAVTRIRGSMLDELRAQDWLPRSARSKYRSIQTAVHALTQKLLRQPTEQEVAQEMGLSLQAYQTLLEESSGVQIFHLDDLETRSDATDRPDQGLEAAFSGSLSVSVNPHAHLLSKSLRDCLVKAIGDLPEREQLVLSLQFEQDLNQREVAAVLGVTEGRVSQLRAQSIVRIRAYLANHAWDSHPGDEIVRQALP